MINPQVTRAQQASSQLVIASSRVLYQSVTISTAADDLWPLFRQAGIAHESALVGALTAVLNFPPDRYGIMGSASSNIAAVNLMRRAQFLVMAARRLDADISAALARPGTDVQAVAQSAVSRETRYYSQQLQATWNRAKAAATVDTTAMSYGRLLGWNTVRDARTSPECLAANGKNFYADLMPLIGYPGAVHPHCRCWPGPPHRGGGMLPGAGRARMVVAA